MVVLNNYLSIIVILVFMFNSNNAVSFQSYVIKLTQGHWNNNIPLPVNKIIVNTNDFYAKYHPSSNVFLSWYILKIIFWCKNSVSYLDDLFFSWLFLPLSSAILVLYYFLFLLRCFTSPELKMIVFWLCWIISLKEHLCYDMCYLTGWVVFPWHSAW